MTRITPRKPENPILWIIAGPNGSGKSSFYNRTDIEGWGGSVWIINPDLLTSRLMEQEGLSLKAANDAALDRMLLWLNASIDVHQTIGVETVLSSGKYRELVTSAKRPGFRVRMIYVVLKSAELQLQRVNIRVEEGGYDVPATKLSHAANVHSNNWPGIWGMWTSASYSTTPQANPIYWQNSQIPVCGVGIGSLSIWPIFFKRKASKC